MTSTSGPLPGGGKDDGLAEILWRDGERVYRRIWRDVPDYGRRECLAVQPNAEDPTQDTIKRLSHEFGLKEHLRSEWALRPIELLRNRGRTLLVLESTVARPLEQMIGEGLPIGKFLQVAVAVSKAVAGLHHAGLVHKDLNAGNILIDPLNGDARLVGFGIASRLPRERQAPGPPESIVGTLSHMAPEQTGRINRSIDSRSDLYSLGITFYHVMTGRLPFTADDPIEWVYCHIARKPDTPTELLDAIPSQLSAIIMKLLAKTPEDRYQTAAAVERDLKRCLHNMETQGIIEEFPLGESDCPERLLMPERLYGRDNQVATLLAAFDHVVVGGHPRLVLVSGGPGIGKSSLVNELHKVLVQPRRLFASGKFDQLTRDIPYATVAQALQSLIRPLLSRPETELRIWRDQLRQAVDPNGALIIELIPDLEFIIGKQLAARDVSPAEAKTRMQSALRQLIGVFARRDHPLALFLDDLQWLDAATLELLEAILVDREPQHLLLIGAYRNTEVDAAHPLKRTLGKVRGVGAIVDEIVLGPLAHQDITRWFADALHAQPERTRPLAQLVIEKTAANPFFAQQFLQELVDDALVAFDVDHACWKWDLAAIHKKGYTDNVIDLMVGKLTRLPAATQEALKGLATLGNRADFSTLALVQGTSLDRLHSDLWEAARVELVIRSDDEYRFVHDRVQEAAYSLIPSEQRLATHLRIGRLLNATTAADKRDDVVFNIVSHLNRASVLLNLPDEREEVAALNLMAGKRAMKAAAFASALNYFSAGEALVETERAPRHDLAFELSLRRAECEFVTGHVDGAEQRLKALSSRAENWIERAAVACQQAEVYLALQRPDQGLAECADCLRQAGLEIPLRATEAEARAAYEEICATLAGIDVEAVAALPRMTNLESRAVLDVISHFHISAVIANKPFEVLMMCAAFRLILERGLHDAAPHVFAQLGYMAPWRFGNFDAGFRFGQLAYELIERKDLRQFEGRVCLIVSTLLMPWSKHVTQCRPVIRRTFEVAERSHDHFLAVQNATTLLQNLLMAGDPLSDVATEAEVHLAFGRTAVFGDYTHALGTQAAFIRCLRGFTRQFGSLDDEQFDERRLESYFATEPHILAIECWYWVRKLQARYFAGDYMAAVEASRRGQAILIEAMGTLERAEHELYSALAHAALFAASTSDEGRAHVEAIASHREQLASWARHCPENLENRVFLVDAEMARIDRRDLDAMQLYEAAIRSARENGFVNNEALAFELAARFYAARGLEVIARSYLREARDGYLRWGADGKVKQLEANNPSLAAGKPSAERTKAVVTSSEQLDLSTVLKLSQAVQGETDLGTLIAAVMRLTLEHAGAQRGLLLLPQGDIYRIEAEAWSNNESVKVSLHQSSVTENDLPESIVQYVVRTRSRVLLHDASTKSEFADDQYLRGNHVRSVLCIPLLKQARLVGIIYVENNLTTGAFTPARIAVLEVLASNAAISLENARLYRDLQEREARVRRLIDSNIIGILIWHDDGRVLDTNDAFLRIVGYDREDLISGRTQWNAFTSPEWQDRIPQLMETFRETGVAAAREWEYVKKDGTRIPVLVGGAIFDEAPDQGVAFVLDLSAVKRAEEAARIGERRYHELQLRLADANRIASIGELSASIAHEINQPLSGIITNAATCLRVLAADPPNVEIACETARRTLRDGNHASGVITRLRALFAKGAAVAQPVDLNEVIREVLALASNELRRERVILRTELDDGLCVVNGDQIQLQQVVFNLLRNAIDAMRSVHDRPRELFIRTQHEDDHRVRVTVTDSGVGFGSQDPFRFFEAFYTTKETGMGIGLSVSRSIIESHQGRLWAQPNQGSGATFSFTLPSSEPPRPTAAA